MVYSLELCYLKVQFMKCSVCVYLIVYFMKNPLQNGVKKVNKVYVYHNYTIAFLKQKSFVFHSNKAVVLYLCKV